MKKCPNCDRTFEDNLKFCQADGTPLVAAEEPPDPYKTMVAGQADLDIPEVKKAEPAEETAEEPAEAASTESEPPAADEEDMLEVPKDDEVDPLKTMVAGTNTSDSIKVEIPDEKPKDAVAESPKPAPEPPKFEEPKVEPPEFTGALSEPEEDEQPAEAEAADAPPPSPFTPDSDALSDEPSAPIPSPFDESMPPGYAPPATPPFDPSEPVKAEKVASTASPAEVAKPDLAEPEESVAAVESGGTEDFSAPPAPFEASAGSEVSSSAAGDPASGGGAEGQDKMMAIISIACGALSMTLCCGSIGVILGPVGVVTGFMARNKIQDDPKQYGGGGLALAGMITGGIGFLLSILLVALWLFGNLAGSF